LDIYGQLQAQALLAAAPAVLVALFARLYRTALVAVVCAGALAANLAPHLAMPPRVDAMSGASAPLRLAWANMRNWATGANALNRLLRVETPDIVLLTELTAHHQPAATAAAYPFRSSFPSGSAFDVLLMSRLRPVDMRFDYSFGSANPVMEARFCSIRGTTACLAIVALHATRPALPAGFFGEPATRRDGMLALAASLARRRLVAGDHVILMGDFNATPYSLVFADMTSASGLADSARAPSERPVRPRPTWLSIWPGVGLAIDHALISPGVRVVERRLGPNIGSDHRPLVLHFRLVDGI
ncbi:MAG TPA: endonuclease/exonuclease/phosphatase family protein, partial [Vineibacter sp.]|nr:endonuclease/exonuclease/phosphatase family protein [Vineibacter sp.]